MAGAGRQGTDGGRRFRAGFAWNGAGRLLDSKRLLLREPVAERAGRAKVPAADERARPARGRQGRGVIGQQHQMAVMGVAIRAAVGRNQRLLGLRVRAPEHEHDGAAAPGHLGDQRVGQLLPALPGVAARAAFFHRQAGVEQQHALPRPAGQAAAGARKGGRGHAQVAFQFFEDVAQRRRQGHTRGHRKGQPFGLPAPVVGVLPEDDDAHALGRREFQRAQRLGRKDACARVQARLQKAQELVPGGAGEKRLCRGPPALGHGPAGGVCAAKLVRLHGEIP